METTPACVAVVAKGHAHVKAIFAPESGCGGSDEEETVSAPQFDQRPIHAQFHIPTLCVCAELWWRGSDQR